MTRQLEMEKAGFNPEDMFTPEEIEKMRSMTPRGYISDTPKKRIGGAFMFNKSSCSGSD
jgi:hypothetical protein